MGSVKTEDWMKHIYKIYLGFNIETGKYDGYNLVEHDLDEFGEEIESGNCFRTICFRRPLAECLLRVSLLGGMIEIIDTGVYGSSEFRLVTPEQYGKIYEDRSY